LKWYNELEFIGVENIRNIRLIVQEPEEKYANQKSLISVLDHSINSVVQSFAHTGQANDSHQLKKLVFMECCDHIDTFENETKLLFHLQLDVQKQSSLKI
jgi:hypothetical protein